MEPAIIIPYTTLWSGVLCVSAVVCNAKRKRDRPIVTFDDQLRITFWVDLCMSVCLMKLNRFYLNFVEVFTDEGKFSVPNFIMMRWQMQLLQRLDDNSGKTYIWELYLILNRFYLNFLELFIDDGKFSVPNFIMMRWQLQLL